MPAGFFSLRIADTNERCGEQNEGKHKADERFARRRIPLERQNEKHKEDDISPDYEPPLPSRGYPAPSIELCLEPVSFRIVAEVGEVLFEHRSKNRWIA